MGNVAQPQTPPPAVNGQTELSPSSPSFTPGELVAVGWAQAPQPTAEEPPSEWEKAQCLRLLPLLRSGYLQ
eukprot:11396782-Heterocapsa_arctica.AAC.1